MECTHLDQVRDITPADNGCTQCLQVGDDWVHLRVCMTCGHVGCCDSSRNRHASRHAGTERHPIVQSYEPGDRWWWCYVDKIGFEVEDARLFSYE